MTMTVTRLAEPLGAEMTGIDVSGSVGFGGGGADGRTDKRLQVATF